MKYWIICCLFVICVPVFGQKADLPKRVLKTFETKFPGVENLKWNVEKGDYKLKFVYNGKKTTVEIDGEDGHWEKTSIHIAFDELPAPVQAAVNKQKKNADIDEIKRVVNDDDELYYRIELLEGNLVTKIDIDEKGTVIKSETEPK